MSLIERYVYEVGEHLPEKMRADIQKEIRSLIEDTLDGRAEASGRSPQDESLVVEVLKEFGPPQKMAASYLPPRYLIGPRLFPTFMLVLRIVLGIVILVGVVQMGVSLFQIEPTLDGMVAKVITQGLSNLLSSAMSVLGNLVLIFAILEWALPKIGGDKAKDWDPRNLAAEGSENERPVLWECIAAIVTTGIALLIFNVYPNIIGMSWFKDGQWMQFPVLSETFFRYLPWLNVLWVLEIILNIVLLRTGKWQPASRWFNIALKVAGMIVLLAMILGDPIVTLTPEAIRAAGEASQAFTQLAPIMNMGIRSLMGFIFVVEGVETARLLYRMLKK